MRRRIGAGVLLVPRHQQPAVVVGQPGRVDRPHQPLVTPARVAREELGTVGVRQAGRIPAGTRPPGLNLRRYLLLKTWTRMIV